MIDCPTCGHPFAEHDPELGCGRFVHDPTVMLVRCACHNREKAPMTDPKYAAIFLLVDRSGSMRAIQEAAQDSINEFVAEQNERVGRTTITIVQFDAPPEYEDGLRSGQDWYLVHCPSLDPALVPPFLLYPRGRTALYDAMVRGIDTFGAELAKLAERDRPGVVIFAVLTDGKENASGAVAADVSARVTRQRDDYGWQFVYLAANQDAILEGEKMGIPAHSSITYTASSAGTRAVTESLGAYTASAAAGERAAFTDEDRKRAMQE